jgi:hypothetical protein
MKFNLLSNKEGYTEIIKFKSQDGNKSFTQTSLYKFATVIVEAKNKTELLKSIEKLKSKSTIFPKAWCINIMLLNFIGVEDSNPFGITYSDFNNVEDDSEAQQLIESGEMLEECFLEMQLPITVK